MKRALFVLSILALFVSASSDKEIPSKLYYLDEEYVESWDYAYIDDGDMSIGLSRSIDRYNFKGPSKIYEIYYDKKFTLLAVRNEYIKENKQEHYQRYDRNGVLRMEWIRKNGKNIGQFRSWYSNANLKNIIYYDEAGQTIADSTFYKNKKLEKTSIYINTKLFKEYRFYENGIMSDEIYHGKPDHKIALIIQYDSITNKPSMFYANDSMYEDLNNPGTFIMSYNLISVDSAIIKKR